MKIVLSSLASGVCLVASDASRIAKVFSSIAPRTPLLGFSISFLRTSGGTSTTKNDREFQKLIQRRGESRVCLLDFPPIFQVENRETYGGCANAN